MLKGSRRIAVAAAAALGLGIGSAVWATSSASAAPSAPSAQSALSAIPPVCTTANLAVWVDRDGSNGAAGTASYPLEFTNVSNHTCRTWGYPGVSATGSNGQQLGSAAARNPLYPGAWVNIPAGGTAHALLAYASAEVLTSGCKPAMATAIKVYPPNQFTADHGFFDLPACTLKGHVYLRVTVIRPGAAHIG
ncbi:MAG TPA: DUF4232 domain-containing protein [Trebonia sp.]|jgi:hypothetical protein